MNHWKLSERSKSDHSFPELVCLVGNVQLIELKGEYFKQINKIHSYIVIVIKMWSLYFYFA